MRSTDWASLRIIAHPDLATGAVRTVGKIRCVSMMEGIYQETQGQDVEFHFTPTEEDEKLLSTYREKVQQQWEKDRLSDGWSRPGQWAAGRLGGKNDDATA